MWKSGRNIIAAVLVAVVGSMVGCNSLAGLLPDSIMGQSWPLIEM